MGPQDLSQDNGILYRNLSLRKRGSLIYSKHLSHSKILNILSPSRPIPSLEKEDTNSWKRI
jgi:hypothetical protein